MAPQKNVQMKIEGEQNLPTSFNITNLIAELTQHESDLDDVIKRVKIIELEPYRSDVQPGEKTRLFLAVAFGKQTVLAQLCALELRHVVLDGSDEDAGDIVDDDDDCLEWVEVSNHRVLGRENGQRPVTNSTSAVIYPPSRADQLPLHLHSKNDNGAALTSDNLSDEITSCEIIPCPTITVATRSSDGDELPHRIIHRTVGILIGTSHDYVYSIPIHVTEQDVNDVKFFIEYDNCETGSKSDVNGEYHHPTVFQVLPPRMMFDTQDEGRKNASDSRSRISVFDGYVDPDMQVFHPTVSQEVNDNIEDYDTHVGVRSLTQRRGDTAGVNQNKQLISFSQDIVWITYENGILVKVPSWKMFCSAVKSDWVDAINVPNIKQVPTESGGAFTIIPLGDNIKSPLDPPIDQLNTMHAEVETPELSKENYWSILKLKIESVKLLQSNVNQSESAIMLPGPSIPTSSIPIQFKSSRSHTAPSFNVSNEGSQDTEVHPPLHNNDEEIDNKSAYSSVDEGYGPATGAVLESTGAMMKGALGAAVDAMRWGLGKSGGYSYEDGDYQGDANDDLMDVDKSNNKEESDNGNALMKSVGQDIPAKSNINCGAPIVSDTRLCDLLPYPLSGVSFEFSDIPRRYESVRVDPTETMAVTTDNLGRVMLFDLETKQPIRIWKGMRNVSCHFTEIQHCVASGNGTQVYLVLHFLKKGIVEIYRLRHGPRVSLVTVPRQNECIVIECSRPLSERGRSESFLLEAINDTGNDCQYFVENLIIEDPEISKDPPQPSQRMMHSASQNSRTMQLNLFMQLLASDTNIPCSAATVLATFKRLKTLTDLGEGLEAVSKCSRLEDEMGVVGSSFHSQAVLFCKSRLEQVKKVESEEGSGVARKNEILFLESKLRFHERLINAFDILSNFESKDDLKDTVADDDNIDLRSASPWASEALSWLIAASENAAARSRFAPTFSLQSEHKSKQLRFSHFSQRVTCKKKNKPISGDNDAVYFTAVKRDRAPIIARIFRPLLRDLFVFKVVNSILSHLGIDSDFKTLQLYFGEWLRMLPYDALKANMSGNWRPMVRWLHDMILNAFDRHLAQDLDDASLEKVVKLEALLMLCNEIEDLPKAYLIGVLCVDAVSTASQQIEEKTYGKITKLESIRPWEIFLRRLRVCLLVSLRLSGEVDSGGFNPLTVSSVSKADTFSTYAWIARDELSLSHENQVLMAMEAAYLSSSEAFYPSTVDGDKASNKETMLQSCGNALRGSLLNPSGLTSDSLSPPLLFYLKDHGRCTSILAAHRALILAGLWGQTPENLLLLRRCVESLQTVENNANKHALAVLVEIWQTRVRSVFQAALFGFDRGDELSQQSFSSLIGDQVWLTEFTVHARTILGMILEYTAGNPTQEKCEEQTTYQKSEMWPPLQECPILNVLASKLRSIKSSSVILHHIVVISFEMMHDINSIASAVPSFSSLFSVGSLFNEMPPIPKQSTEQLGLIDKATIVRAQQSSNPVIDNFDCIKDVELVGKTFGLDSRYIKTRYLIEMIRLGRDSSIDDLLGATSIGLMQPLFIDDVIQILCARLQSIISSLKRTKQYRAVVSRLDAEASNWVKEQAECASQDEYKPVSLITTHTLILRLRGMAADDVRSERINSLYLMSETLLKAVKEQEQQRVIDV